MSADGLAPVDTESPWLGLSSFSEETRAFFHGREEEVAELARRVQRKLLTVLFGQSGLGKTSILRAGLVPRLRPQGYCPVYVRIDYAPESPPPAEQIKQAIFRATEASGTWTQPGTSVAGESLWEFLHHRDDLLKDASGKTLVPLLIFDQFEEIFTIAQTDDAVRQRAAEFLAELADLVENRPPKALEALFEADDAAISRFDFARADYRILISLREDYLAHLEGVKASMPSITQNRMRIARMTGDQALSAVTKPGGKLVTQEVAESIVRFVAGGSELRNAEVEPALLSLICRELNNARIAQGRSEITADLLAGSHDTILHEFYERALADQPAAVRRFIEDEMLTDSGFRESLAEERVLKAFAAAGAAPDALATLVNRRLLRVEERLDVRRVELTHDVLCAVVGASRELRHEREARDAAERSLAEQKAREEATHKALVRARKIAAGCIVLAAIAVAGAVFGWISMNRARDAEAVAEKTRQLAEGGRGEAEKLVTYLLEDFQVELEPVGRLEVVASLAKRALGYYDGLPPELRTSTTERNRALAQVRYAITLRNLGRLDEAGKAAQEAVAVLGKLREGGDASEATLVGLAMGLSAQARVLNQQGAGTDATRLSTRSYESLKPAATAPQASAAVRRAFGEVALAHGFNVLRSGEAGAALPVLEDSRTALRSIDGLKLGDLSSAALYVEATSWQMDGLQALRRVQEARAAGEEALKVANGMLAKQPGHMLALRARGLLNSNLGEIAADDFKLSTAVPYFRAAVHDYETYLKVDPGNTIAWNNLAAQLMLIGLFEEALGRPQAGLRHLRTAADTASQGGTMTTTRAVNAAGVWFHVGRIEAELGNDAAARSALDAGNRLMRRAIDDAPAGSFRKIVWSAWPLRVEAYRRVIAGEFQPALEAADAALRVLEPAKPESEGQKRMLADYLSDGYFVRGLAAYARKDYAAAEAAMRRTLEIVKEIPDNNRPSEVSRLEVISLHGLYLARLGRSAEANAVLAEPLKYLEALPKDSDADSFRSRIAVALLARAVANPGEASARLSEAAAIVDRLPAEMRRMATIARLRQEIAAEQARVR